MTIKKPYVDIITFLKANESKKVSTILEEIKSMCESKVRTTTFLKDDNDKVFAIFCYYHKQWELLVEVDYGSKISSSTGLNTMCKLGVRGWTKLQKELKSITETALELVMKSELDVSEIKNYKQEQILIITAQVSKSHQHESHLYHNEDELMA